MLRDKFRVFVSRISPAFAVIRSGVFLFSPHRSGGGDARAPIGFLLQFFEVLAEVNRVIVMCLFKAEPVIVAVLLRLLRLLRA